MLVVPVLVGILRLHLMVALVVLQVGVVVGLHRIQRAGGLISCRKTLRVVRGLYKQNCANFLFGVPRTRTVYQFYARYFVRFQCHYLFYLRIASVDFDYDRLAVVGDAVCGLVDGHARQPHLAYHVPAI